MYAGGTKKFLYTGPQKEAEDEDQWSQNFTPKMPNSSRVVEPTVDLSNVWSIQKNVSLGITSPSLRPSDRLTHNAGKGLYSRHGGMRVNSDFGKDQGVKPLGAGNKGVTGMHWSGARGSSFNHSLTIGHNSNNNMTHGASNSSHTNRDIRSNPSAPRFDHPDFFPDENDF